MSAGFIEPLEASALALVELSANMIRDQLPATRTDMDIVARHFNNTFLYRWQRIIEFLKLHYALTQRTDTDYWRDASRPESFSESLRELLSLWRFRPPYHNDFVQGEEIFPAASYHYVLYGMDFQQRQKSLGRASDNIEQGLNNIKENLERSNLISFAANHKIGLTKCQNMYC
jgi:hypothetical protein